MSKKLFDVAIGNPPYQDETIGDNTTYAPPVYNNFLDEAYKVANKVIMIHPARFLFNAGSTPKAWNKKMLEDPSFKILHYEADSSKIFSNTDIKGGVAISYHDDESEFGAIEIFTPYDELNSLFLKVKAYDGFQSFSDIIVTSYAYHFLERIYQDYPEAKGCLSNGHEYDLKSNVFEKMPMVFSINKPSDGDSYIRVLGRLNNKRAYRFVREKHINNVRNLHSFKLFMSGATGTGKFGETIAEPIIGLPGDASTETFLSIGAFEDESCVHAVTKYIKTKFARALFGILKRTQANTPGKWAWVPLQDFTSASDIDWSQSIHNIDLQLYRKYNLSKEEVDFIETNVKEMV